METGEGIADVADTGTASSDWLSANTLMKGGALAAGGAGLGMMLAQGPGELPGQYRDLQGGVPGMRSQSELLSHEGSALVGQGTEALRMGAAGELTPAQQAQLNQYHTGLTNQARQQFYGMGRNPDQDTAFISQTADIDAKANAMAQEQIRSTITLGLGEITGGSSLSGQALGFTNAANQALIAAGEAQIKMDENYSKSLTSAFTAIGSMAGMAAGAAVGGPAGAAAGASLGGMAGKAMG